MTNVGEEEFLPIVVEPAAAAMKSINCNAVLQPLVLFCSVLFLPCCFSCQGGCLVILLLLPLYIGVDCWRWLSNNKNYNSVLPPKRVPNYFYIFLLLLLDALDRKASLISANFITVVWPPPSWAFYCFLSCGTHHKPTWIERVNCRRGINGEFLQNFFLPLPIC